MAKKFNLIINTDPAKYLNMKDFAERLAITNGRIIDHKGGFFLDSKTYRAAPFKNGDSFVDVFSIFYTPGGFKGYIAIDSNGKYELKDEVPPSSCAFFSKVIKFEDYELDKIDKKILEAIRKNEEFRKPS